MILRQAISLLAGLLAATFVVWALAFSIADGHAVLIGTGALAFGLGLRHAIDPDHLAAIDNVTRKLAGEGQTPLAIGFFFALGHSTFVLIIICLLALSTLKLGDGNLALWQNYGEVISTLFSAMFLILIGLINLKALVGTRGRNHHHPAPRPMGRIWTRVSAPLFGSISKSRHMFPIGFLFALSFDTATEISLFGMTAAQGLGGSLTLLQTLMFPLLFAIGMILADTLNGLMMLGAYRWAAFHDDRKQVYNIMITGFSVFAAFGIATMQLFSLAASHSKGVEFADHLVAVFFEYPTTLGLAMIGIFFIIWISAVTMTKFTRPAQALRQEG